MLSRAFGAPARVSAIELLSPWSVMRCRLAAPFDAVASGSVVLKWLRDDPSGFFRVDPRQLATERAALEFLAEIGFEQAPRLLASGGDPAILVLEDLAPRVPLDDLLRRHGSRALPAALLVFARSMAAMNAATVRRSGRFDSLLRRYGAGAMPSGPGLALGPQWAATRERLAGEGLAMSSAIEHELVIALEALAEPGPFFALTNGDPEANNFLIDGSDGCIIDFEFATYRHALTCATWMYVPGPAWITVSDERSIELEREYRTLLCAAITEAEDDRLFGVGMASACLVKACERLGRFAVLDRRRSGDGSRVQMVSTLESAAAVARRHRSLPHLAGWVECAAQFLRSRWPDADADIATMTAYTPRPP